jgi:hypothetical protein
MLVVTAYTEATEGSINDEPNYLLLLVQMILRIVCCAVMSGLEFIFNLKLVILVLRDLKADKSLSQQSESDIFNRMIVMKERRILIGVLIGVTFLDLAAILLIALPSNGTEGVYIMRFGALIYAIHISLSLFLLEMLFHSMARIKYVFCLKSNIKDS